jgi:hypothetical protein
MDTPQVLLEHQLKTLRLPTFLREYDKVAQQCAAEGVDFPRYLLRLSELELLDRERRATERRIRQAKFDVVKSLDSFDFLAIPSLNKTLVLDLAGDQQPAVQRMDRSIRIRAADGGSPGPAHSSRPHPGDERGKLSPQRQQTEAAYQATFLVAPASTPGADLRGRLPLRPKRSPQSGSQAYAPAAPVNPSNHGRSHL